VFKASRAPRGGRALLGLVFRDLLDPKDSRVRRVRREFRVPLLERATQVPQDPKELLEI
jgi:hypothetical protein